MTLSLRAGHVIDPPRQNLHGRGVQAVDDSAETHENLFTDTIVVTFEGKCFQFSGVLRFGRREEAVLLVERLGGYSPSGSSLPGVVNFLVVGNLEKRALRRNGYGAMITKAMDLNRKAPCQIHIIPERDFVEALVKAMDTFETGSTTFADPTISYRSLLERRSRAHPSRSNSTHS